jgi:hypothetical protein
MWADNFNIGLIVFLAGNLGGWKKQILNGTEHF